MKYGAEQSNPREAQGLAAFVLGLIALVAGWAYGAGILEVLVVIVGLILLAAGIYWLRSARAIVGREG